MEAKEQTALKTIDRRKAPPIVDAVDYRLKLPPYRKYVLNNGVEVYTVDAGAEEVLLVEWVFFAGNSYEEQNLVAATTNFLLRNGTTTRSAFEINEHFEYYGSYLNRSCFNETATITLHCLNKHIAELLPVVRELITDSIMPQSELAIYQQNMKQRLAVNLKKSDFVAGRIIDASIYGENHPYGKYSTDEALDALQREQLLEYYNKYYREGRLVMFAAGKIPSNLEALLNASFGDLGNNNNLGYPEPAMDPSSQKKQRVINDPEGMQGSIRIARPFPNRHHPDFLKAQVLNVLFGGYFGSRLMSNIREEKGYTYGIHSYLHNHIQASAWMTSTEAGKQVIDATITEIYKEMEDLRENLVEEEELHLVRNYMMGSILGDLDGPFQIIARWKNIILNGLDESYFYKSIETIRSITAEELRELARKYFSPEEFYELVVI
jgi:predicted Zn-dependent peptidase